MVHQPLSCLCVGEILWDALPRGLFLGGAPLNVACHLRQLGVGVAFASRIGHDRLGRTILNTLAMRGLGAELIQTDTTLETGFVEVTFKNSETPVYEIVAPAAWDALEATAPLLEAASAAGMLVFGSLAQRSATTRATLRALWQRAAFKVYDINLRPPSTTDEIVAESLPVADLLKLNDEELLLLGRQFGLQGDSEALMRGLASRFEIDTIIVTRGGAGACGLERGHYAEHPGFAVTLCDPVGAGDAFLAGLLAARLAGQKLPEMLATANRLGSTVASLPGATPALAPELMRSLGLCAVPA
jgi:fructokinase